MTKKKKMPTDLNQRAKAIVDIQLSTHGFGCCGVVVDALWRGNIDYAQIIKEYGAGDTDHRYSPAVCRPHQTLTKAAKAKTTPAMAAGIESYPWSISQLCELLED